MRRSPSNACPRIPRYVSIPGVDIAPHITQCRSTPLPYAERREMFPERLAETVQSRAGGQVVQSGALANPVERLWPPQSPRAFLRDLLGSRRRLLANARGDVGADEAAQLFRVGADRVDEEVWADADVPLLDELRHLIVGTEDTFRHIVVDEAQDLSAM